MDKRYQVFISSTFSDLKDERQQVLRAILELDHMPAGMELFPAADDSAWQLIRDVIDASDYYVVIIGGRYGSLDEKGIGYTEKEYDYAVESRKPVLPLLHHKPSGLPREKTDTEEAAWKKLEAFRKKVEGRHTCVYWTSAEDLKAKVIIGITTAVKRSPAVGWIRADKIPTEATVAEILSLRNRIAELEKEKASEAFRAPKGTEDLLQEDDKFKVELSFTARDPDDSYPYRKDEGFDGWIEPTWNEIFAAVAPLMIHEARNSVVRNAIEQFFVAQARKMFEKDRDFKRKELKDFVVAPQQVDTVIIQLRALGLVRHSVKPRSVKDTTTYWSLTPFGDNLMTRLRAIRRGVSLLNPEHEESDGPPAGQSDEK
jgi:Domain of unknown function (DUF4062)